MATTMINETPCMKDGSKRSPEQIFSQSNVQPNQKYWRTFGCPVYVLQAEFQTGGPFHKWKQISKVGIYLGRSPQHARSIALVLDRTTGLVSPQFHVSFDSNFDTVTKDDHDDTWKIKAGFVTRIKPPVHKITSPRGRNTSTTRYTSEVTSERMTEISTARDERIRRRNFKKRDSAGDIKRTEDETRSSTSNTPEGGNATNPEGVQRVLNSTVTDGSSPNMIIDEHEISETSEIFCLETIFPQHNEDEEEERRELCIYKAISDPDTMYMHQEMQ